jgi:hypothetical protein
LQRHCLARHGVKPAKPPQGFDGRTPSNTSEPQHRTPIESPWLGQGTPEDSDAPGGIGERPSFAISSTPCAPCLNISPSRSLEPNPQIASIPRRSSLLPTENGTPSAAAKVATRYEHGNINEALTGGLSQFPNADEILGDNNSSRVDSGIDYRHMSSLSYQGLEWLFDDDSIAQYGIFELQSPLLPTSMERSTSLDNLTNSEVPLLNRRPLSSPISGSEIEIELERIVSNVPECRYQVCHALTEEHRIQLLWSLHSDLPDLDIEDPLLSLDCLKHGIHFYFKYVSPEYSIFHRCLITHMGTHKRHVQISYGEKPPCQLIWAMIILGWSVPSLKNASDKRKICELSQKIHKALRSYVLAVSSEYSTDTYLSFPSYIRARTLDAMINELER